MAENWESFFGLVNTLAKEVKTKGVITSPVHVLESMLEKMEYCINVVTRIQRVIEDAINGSEMSDCALHCVYLQLEMNRFAQ